MQNSLYVNLSAQVALDKRLTTTANNVANMATAGFRAEETKFSALLAQATKGAVAFVGSGDTYLSRASGQVSRTDSPLDVAVQGDAWLAIRGTSGPAYTRDGRLTMDATGQLRTLTGQPVLDPGGAPLLLDPQQGPPTIGRDGSIYQGTNQVGALGVYTIDKAATLTRAPGNAVTPSLPAKPVQDFTGIGIVQGYVEGSNVNPIMEMTKLISIQRAFESAATATAEAESSLQSAVKSLSPQGS
ncbi:flagellar basal-body rod protein FlgF [Methylobacterium terrae]|uniref:Flagellar basal-body rod protein FlgF n=1 Tax=Methylobacterium terrae TaxID=2202827 RepID=A0A2U8WIQ8_9HYPH|nr:flagellar basal-body rod protein FlgF [Methylobacterium terrae]AWN46003.1 flagellar basal-body rod protein FlgF [Methylobacterium terrae]